MCTFTSFVDFTSVLDVILGGYNASVNYYTFEGGTNFGFNAGANTQTEAPHYAPDVTSYGIREIVMQLSPQISP